MTSRTASPTANRANDNGRSEEKSAMLYLEEDPRSRFWTAPDHATQCFSRSTRSSKALEGFYIFRLVSTETGKSWQLERCNSAIMYIVETILYFGSLKNRRMSPETFCPEGVQLASRSLHHQAPNRPASRMARLLWAHAKPILGTMMTFIREAEPGIPSIG